MKPTRLAVGYIPLIDAAPLVVAHEIGFAAEEGLALDLRAAPSWSSLRDMLGFGQVDAAHMLSPVPVANALGAGRVGGGLIAASVLSMNGTVIGVSRELEARLRAGGHAFDFADARAAGEALIAANPEGLRIGVPFPFSMHAELLHYWLGALGYPVKDRMTIRTVPPPMMVDAIGAGEIDAFCVGEPWGSMAVENGLGALLLPGCAIWKRAPEKVLAARAEWAETESVLLGRLVRAVWRAGRWLAEPNSRTLAAELLARPPYLGIPAEVIDRALSGRLVISSTGEERSVAGFVEFAGDHANIPFRDQAEWIGRRLAARLGRDADASESAARAVFRPDIFARATEKTGVELPSALLGLDGNPTLPSPGFAPDMFFDCDGFEHSESE